MKNSRKPDISISIIDKIKFLIVITLSLILNHSNAQSNVNNHVHLRSSETLGLMYKHPEGIINKTLPNRKTSNIRNILFKEYSLPNVEEFKDFHYLPDSIEVYHFDGIFKEYLNLKPSLGENNTITYSGVRYNGLQAPSIIKEAYKYDSKGRQIQFDMIEVSNCNCNVQNHDDQLETSLHMERYEYTNDLLKIWELETSTYNGSREKEQYKYNDKGHLISVQDLWYGDSAGFFAYDSLDRIRYYSPNDGYTERYEYIPIDSGIVIRELGMPLSSTSIEYLDAARYLDTITISTYKYNQNKQIVSVLREYHPDYFHEYLPYVKEKIIYNYANSLLVKAQYYRRDTLNLWQEHMRYFYSYNEADDPKEIDKQFYDGMYNEWTTFLKKTYHYSNNSFLVANVKYPVQRKLKIFPNPVYDYIHFTTASDFSGLSDYAIYNNSGTKVQSGKLTNNSIKTTDLQFGNYFLVIYYKGKTYTSNFIKQD